MKKVLIYFTFLVLFQVAYADKLLSVSNFPEMGTLLLIDTETFSKETLYISDRTVNGAKISPDKQTIAIYRRVFADNHANHSLRLLSLSTLSIYRELPINLSDVTCEYSVSNMNWLDAGKIQLDIYTDDKTILGCPIQIDVKTGQVEWYIKPDIYRREFGSPIRDYDRKHMLSMRKQEIYYVDYSKDAPIAIKVARGYCPRFYYYRGESGVLYFNMDSSGIYFKSISEDSSKESEPVLIKATPKGLSVQQILISPDNQSILYYLSSDYLRPMSDDNKFQERSKRKKDVWEVHLLNVKNNEDFLAMKYANQYSMPYLVTQCLWSKDGNYAFVKDYFKYYKVNVISGQVDAIWSGFIIDANYLIGILN